MLSRFLTVFIATLLLLCAAPKKNTGTARGENQDLILDVTIYIDGAAVKDVVGDDLSGHFIVAQVKVEPKFGKEIVIDRDDFLLRTDKDGEKATPYSGSQIAGKGALIIGTVDKNQGVASPGWTGIHAPVVKGGGASTPKDGQPAVKAPPDNSGDASLQKTLDSKILPEGKTDKPVSGLLYFPLEKQKMKDLELHYGDKEHRITMRFKP